MKNIAFVLIILLSISCKENPKAKFSLIGDTNGIENGTILYLTSSLANELIDSALVENNHFKFLTRLSHEPLRTILSTKDYSHYRYLWLENNPKQRTQPIERGKVWEAFKEVERYADDMIVHCDTFTEAQEILNAIEQRLKECKLGLNRSKTKIVHCQNSHKRQAPIIWCKA